MQGKRIISTASSHFRKKKSIIERYIYTFEGIKSIWCVQIIFLIQKGR